MPALGDAELRLIDLLVRLLPDIRVKPEMLDYMNGLRADHDHIAASTLYRALKKLGHTHKGLTKRALEADPEDVETYRAWMDLFEDHEHFIWLDETSKDSTTSKGAKRLVFRALPPRHPLFSPRCDGPQWHCALHDQRGLHLR